ncbi:MAG: carboxypeptidase regulatory-like domain-containing protein [Bryobacteraceae bacterium]
MNRNTVRALLLALSSAVLLAQSENAEIRGSVVDSSGGSVAGARVTLKDRSTNVERSTVANEQGIYAFPALRIGSYEVRAEREGFKPAVSTVPQLRVADRVRVDLVLAPGEVATEVTVQSEVTGQLETETSSRGQIISSEQIRELPLNRRDYTQLVLLAPGTVTQPGRRIGGAININGNRPLQNNFLLDGVDNNSNATSFRGERVDVIRPSVDAVAEFKVQTNAFSAEFGRSAGGAVNVTIKSGTNQFRGTLWEFFRNDALDAKGWTPTADGRKPKLRYNLFGANLGGPIRRDRTFFFVNYEREMERQGVSYISTMPTDALIRGDFNNVPITGDLRIQPRDPLTVTAANPAGTPFPNLVIPQSRWDSVSRKIASVPEFPRGLTGAGLPFQGYYLSTVTNRTDVDRFDTRIDHNVTDKLRIFARYSFSDLETFRPGVFPGLVEGSFNDGFGTTATRGQHAVAAGTWVLSPTTLAELRLGYTRMGANVFPPNFGSPGPTELLGIPNLPSAKGINGGWSKMILDGMSSFGRHTSTPQFQIPNVYVLDNTWNLLRGKHAVRFGYNAQHIQTAVLDVSALIGVFRFNRNQFSNNPWGDFLLGLPTSHSQTSYSVLYNRKWINSFFLQDDYKIARTLTVNLGLRYEYSTPIYEKYNHLVNFNPATGQRTLANDGGRFERSLVNPDRTNFGPRVGLAWTVEPKTVVRSAFGIFYNHTNRQGREGLLGMNSPFVVDLTRVQGIQTPNPITLQGGPPVAFLSNATTVDQVQRGNDPYLSNPYVMQWNFTVQRQLVRGWLFEAGYVGNRGVHNTRFLNANQALRIGPSATLQQRRPFPQFADIQYMDSGATASFHSVQTRLERSFANGLSFLHSFTYGRLLSNSGNWLDGFLTPQDSYNYAVEWGLDPSHVKANSVANWVYTLPFGRGRKWGAGWGRAVNGFVGGWEASGIWTVRSGFPITITSSACGDCNLGDRTQRADVVAGQNWKLDNRSAASWFNPAAFRAAVTPFGTAGKGIVVGPALQNWDFTFAKFFPVTERMRIQFRGELFNAFNQVNLNFPNSNVSGGGFGVITSAQPGRSIQLGLKLYY